MSSSDEDIPASAAGFVREVSRVKSVSGDDASEAIRAVPGNFNSAYRVDVPCAKVISGRAASRMKRTLFH